MEILDDFNSRATKLYGPSCGANAIKARFDILTKYTMEKLQIMSLNELKEVCQYQKKVRIPYIRALKLLGLDVTSLEIEYELYEEFKVKYIAKFGRNNLQRVYENYYKPILFKFSKESLKNGMNEINEIEFKKWLDVFKKHKKPELILNIFTILNPHESIIQFLKEYIATDEEVEKAIILYKEIFGKSICYRDMAHYINDLTTLKGEKNIDQLDQDEYRKYCISGSNKHLLLECKINILEMYHVSSQIVKQLRTEFQQKQDNFQMITELLKRLNLSSKKLTSLKEIFDVFHCVENILTMNSTQILENFNKISDKCLCYTLLKEILPEKTFAIIDNKISHKYKGIKISEAYLDTNFKIKLMSEIKEKTRVRLNNTSAYSDDAWNKISYNTSKIFKFVEEFVLREYSEVQEIEPLRWFLHVCTLDMVKKVILEYGQSAKADNTRVKNTQEEHHAKKKISNIISFFKRSVNHIIPCAHEVQGLTPSIFTSQIENQRVPADPQIRRTYSDQEIEKMLQIVSDKPVDVLLITLLREIGLRAGAICNLKYKDIVDEFHKPRHHCRVIEKGRKYREFVTGPNLKRIIVTYIHYIEGEDLNNPDLYVFSRAKNFTKPLSTSTLSSHLKTIALNAGVTDVIVHPHAFRHTIVGKLIDGGNSTELVSKFMGHSSTDTTLKFYYVKTVDELARELKNPFQSCIVTPAEMEQEKQDEIYLLNRRLDSALEIIFSMKAELINALENELSVKELVDNINKEIPGMDRLVRKIADSSVDTTTVMSLFSNP